MVHSANTTTIIAQCTPLGSGALALIRLSGPQAWDIVDQCAYLGKNKRLLDQQSHTVHWAKLQGYANQTIDHVMLLALRAPRTFTGEDCIEITCHNNSFLIEAIIKRAVELGAVPAKGGEFTQRAVHHGKLDLLQAEAIHDLITAQTEQALRKSLEQLEGSFSSWIQAIEHELVRALAWCEASFDFLDEGDEFGAQINILIQKQITLIEKLLVQFDQQQTIKQGIRIALLGCVNAGKSSLFNALLGKNRAIVSDQAGTTRDSIEGSLVREGIFWTLIDTAGLRETSDAIEQLGIERSFDEARSADIILLIFDSSRLMTDAESAVYQRLYHEFEQKVITIHNKCDIYNPHFAEQYSSRFESPALRVAGFHQQGISLLERAIQHKVEEKLRQADAPFLINKRHYHILLALQKQLAEIVEDLGKNYVAYELLSIKLKMALEQISEMTGKSISEAGMDMVFKEFCVGK